ncbi:MAG: hypothetical protein PHI14_01255 [Bacteroidales bacterium]|nr:hypothetical protein [Bacteroidales bacterium]
MKKRIFYTLYIFLIIGFYGCEDVDYCNDCEGLCCYRDFSSPKELKESIELDMDSDGENDVMIKNANPGVQIKGIASNIEVSTGYQSLTLPSRPYSVIYENHMLNYGWDWKNSITTNESIKVGDYIGVRFKGEDCYYYGWIKVSASPVFKIYSFYMYKGVNEPVYAGVRNPNCN